MKCVVVTVLLFCFQLSAGSIYATGNEKTNKNLTRPIKYSSTNISAERTVLSFLTWYKNNQEKLKKIAVVNGTPGDSTKYYAVDFEKVNEFLLKLKRSGFVSNKFNSALMVIFKKCDENLKLYPQFDGPVTELEYDIVFGVQEQEDITKHINDIKTLSEKTIGNKSLLILGIGKHLRLNVNLSKYNNKWLIDTYKATYL